jgi:hypothetical protein
VNAWRKLFFEPLFQREHFPIAANHLPKAYASDPESIPLGKARHDRALEFIRNNFFSGARNDPELSPIILLAADTERGISCAISVTTRSCRINGENPIIMAKRASVTGLSHRWNKNGPAFPKAGVETPLSSQRHFVYGENPR